MSFLLETPPPRRRLGLGVKRDAGRGRESFSGKRPSMGLIPGRKRLPPPLDLTPAGATVIGKGRVAGCLRRPVPNTHTAILAEPNEQGKHGTLSPVGRSDTRLDRSGTAAADAASVPPAGPDTGACTVRPVADVRSAPTGSSSASRGAGRDRPVSGPTPSSPAPPQHHRLAGSVCPANRRSSVQVRESPPGFGKLRVCGASVWTTTRAKPAIHWSQPASVSRPVCPSSGHRLAQDRRGQYRDRGLAHQPDWVGAARTAEPWKQKRGITDDRESGVSNPNQWSPLFVYGGSGLLVAPLHSSRQICRSGCGQ
jgi:hypothetical protein